jgi:hypothetical protein
MAYKNGEIEGALRYEQNEALDREVASELSKAINMANEKK